MPSVTQQMKADRECLCSSLISEMRVSLLTNQLGLRRRGGRTLTPETTRWPFSTRFVFGSTEAGVQPQPQTTRATRLHNQPDPDYLASVNLEFEGDEVWFGCDTRPTVVDSTVMPVEEEALLQRTISQQ